MLREYLSNLGCLGLCLALSFAPIRGSQVRPLTLEQMTHRAERIFSGRCIDVTHEKDPALGATVSVVTLTVERPVKGALSERVTFRMLGKAGFRAGEEVVLYLYGENGLGLTSPVAMGQGKFELHTDKTGRKLAVRNSLSREAPLEVEELLDRTERILAGSPRGAR